MPQSKVFVSYSHRDGEFIWHRLVPVLKAAGAEILIDVDRFRLGVGCERQMNDAQDNADFQLLCFSQGYLDSTACDHEWRRAVAMDADFVSGTVIPLKLEDIALPEEVEQANPLYANLAANADPAPWRQLLRDLELQASWCPLNWLDAAQVTLSAIRDMRSVNLVVENGLLYASLLEHFQESEDSSVRLRKLKCVSLTSGRCAARRGLLMEILGQFGIRDELPRTRPHDIVEFDRLLSELGQVRLAIEHFDMVATPERRKQYGNDLFACFFDLTQKRKLSLLVISKRPYATLLPKDHPVSAIPFVTARLNRP